MFWLIHKLKAGNIQGFNKKKWLNRIKDQWFEDNSIASQSIKGSIKDEPGHQNNLVQRNSSVQSSKVL